MSSTSRCPFLNVPLKYQFGDVDPKYAEVQHAPTSSASLAKPGIPINYLQQFKGSWAGVGFNTIFRPNNTITPTSFTNAPAVPTSVAKVFQVNNVLELNVTQESLSFTESPILGKVPNRGNGSQADIFLAGTAYLQIVSDVLNPSTFKADNPVPTVLHVEPGLWMRVPGSGSPSQAATIIRMGSIPHGTTINTSGLSSDVTVKPGPPSILAINLPDMSPGGAGQLLYSLDANNPNTPRIPQDLRPYAATGTITQDMLTNPHSVLTNANQGLNIIQTTILSVAATQAEPSAEDVGSGIVSIPFLDGTGPTPGTTMNAAVVQFACTFYIEQVQYTLDIPACKAGQPFNVTPSVPNPGSPPVTFEVTPPTDITAPKQITVESFQLQYHQLVMLAFAGFKWPHVSVGTLVPDLPVVVPASAFGS